MPQLDAMDREMERLIKRALVADILLQSLESMTKAELQSLRLVPGVAEQEGFLDMIKVSS